MKLLSNCPLALLVGTFLFAAGCGNTSSTPPPAAPLTATTTTLSATPVQASAGAQITLTATVSSTSGTPVDTVTFFDGTTSLGVSTLGASATTTSTQSQAFFYVNTFSANTTHSITAVFSGDAIHLPSTSSASTVSVVGSAAPSQINAHATFSFATANQTISGFGAAEAFDLQNLDSNPYSAEMYKALFDPTAGLGLTYLRVQDNYRGSTSNFDPDTPKIVAGANSAHGTPLTVLMSSWTPPANLKSNGTVNGCSIQSNGNCTGGTGTLITTSTGGYDYVDFAQYWYDSLNAYAALGVVPNFISIQNEPDFTPPYVGCRFNPTEATYNGTNYAGYGLAFDAVYKKIQTLTSVPKMVGPETFQNGQTFLDLGATIPTNEVAAYAHHNYNVNSGSASTAGVITPGGSPDNALASMTKVAAAFPGAARWTSEYYDTPGFYNAWTIHNALAVANDNAYIFWQAVWPSQLTTAKDQSADQQGLLYADNPFANQATWAFPHGWTYNDAYYSLKHYSFFVKPGYIRYNATIDNTDERVSVFQSPDKKTTVIVVLNVGTNAAPDGLALNLTGITYANSIMYRSSFGTPITSGERFANIGPYLAPSVTTGTNTNGGINLPPQSVVTIVLTN